MSDVGSAAGPAQGDHGDVEGDPRAAGVLSGEDPYRDFELYLEKVAVSRGV